MKFLLTALQWLLLLFTHKGLCIQRIDCQWGPYDDWSECDGCTKLQTRSRARAVYAQFGGNLCDGEPTQTRSCETTKGCPLEDGCGDRFRCLSGKCVNPSMLCNGEVDCEGDGHDEGPGVCEIKKWITCGAETPPSNVELLGLGFDVVSGKWGASVMNTKSFGGQCRFIRRLHPWVLYRAPLSTLKYTFMSKAQNDFSDATFDSKWDYAKDIVNRQKVSGTTSDYHNYDFHEIKGKTQTHRLLVLRSDIEVVRFESTAPQYIPLSDEFWRAVAKLPSVYDYSAYRKVLERFGTHYLSEGSLGGSFRVFAKIDEETERQMGNERLDSNECERSRRWLHIFPINRVDCSSGQHQQTSSRGNIRSDVTGKVEVEGGGVEHVAALTTMQLNDPDINWEMYSNWSESVGSFPKVIKPKLQPLWELVKEVQCAGLKRLHLRRATEQYRGEGDVCHCRPCLNNGFAFLEVNVCKCICKPGTWGLACEQGAEVDGQQGVIDGSWSCWSAWTSSSQGRRSRSRSCSNPAPQNGGQQCIGESMETSEDEDTQLQYLKTVEPQCFNQTLPAPQRCGTPPALINGYILDPKDVYLVGSRVEYTCTPGFYNIGVDPIECTADQTWSHRPGLCSSSRCRIGSLADGVIASPSKEVFGRGSSVTLSCPEGRQLIGEATVVCDPSYRFDPNPRDARCSPASGQKPSLARLGHCQRWEKFFGGICDCKMFHECNSSLELCADTHAMGRKPNVVSVCVMQVLQCEGKKVTLADDSTCIWPQRNTTGCTNCHMWETCGDQTNECVCRDSADCPTPGSDVCVRVGDDAAAAPQTMSECEAGLRRCKGEKVSVLSILPCTS
ncbi:complement component C7 [Pleuronectes platessa]|uniref:complement component C7 n=1 Tax=Pleuronectes platessa TaxID=8262 RepID=UPI00232A3AE7|nr:complement component C7 [Pleuronectes platessa]